ncbi:MAG: aminotransferase class V-fold PLP-dependent enzyme [Deltaproteobacteria bacterium]|nr:aminotransferase class V-fold PLP-dependent enzyme [Deltaproteobacteria bacterium]
MRDAFLLDPGVVFLNHGSFGACPREVFAVYQRYQLELERQPVEFLGRRSHELLRDARRSLAAYLHANLDELVFVPNATTAVNAIARSLPLSSGDEVLGTDQEYGACDNVWRHACARAGATYVRAEVPLPLGTPTAVADAIWSRVGPRTRVIFLSHLTSTTAVILPIAELCRRARGAGILTVIDGAHAPGQIPLDLTAIDADAYVGNCHKWMCAPKGAGFMALKAHLHPIVDATVISWGYGDVVGHVAFEAYVGDSALLRRHQWQGTRDLAAFLAVPAAIEFQQRHGWDAVRARCHAMAADFRRRVDARTGLAPICDDEAFGQMVAIQWPADVLSPEALKDRLWERHRIEVPITTHGGRVFVRVSVQAYNEPRDLDALYAALDEVLREHGR